MSQQPCYWFAEACRRGHVDACPARDGNPWTEVTQPTDRFAADDEGDVIVHPAVPTSAGYVHEEWQAAVRAGKVMVGSEFFTTKDGRRWRYNFMTARWDPAT